MTDTVLQSFCERCGTRYTFTEQDTRRESGLSKIGRSLGLRSAPKPTGEPTVENALPTHDPFRTTFHFCLECRQYTCQNCWNADAGYCQTCYPLGAVDLRGAEKAASAEAKQAAPAAFAASAGLVVAAPPSSAAITGSSAPAPATDGAWPMSDLERAAHASAVTPAPAEAPATEASEGPSPWGPGVADVAPDEEWDASPSIDEDSADPQGGQESVAAAILRAAGGPAPAAEDAAFDQAPPEQALVDAVDPWRGLVYSSDEPQPPVDELVDTPAAIDPALPWLAGAAAGPDEPVDDEPDETPLLTDDEDAPDIDHRGWIAASMIATGSGWSSPVPASPDESVAAAAAAAAEIEARAADETASPWVASPVEPDAVDELERPVAWIEPLHEVEAPVGVEAPVEVEAALAADEQAAEVAEVLLDDGAELVEDDPWGAPADDDIDAWPAADTLAPAVMAPTAEPVAERDREHEWIAPVLAAAAADAVIDDGGESERGPGLELPTLEPSEPEPESEPESIPVAGWTPTLDAPVTPYVPVATGPFASASPLAPESVGPYVPPVEAIPAYGPPPVMPTHASAPPPPLGMMPPPPGVPGPMTQPQYVAPMPPMPMLGLQGPAAVAPPAPAAGPAGQAKARPCQSCALPLSAKARFCRRCGAQQAA